MWAESVDMIGSHSCVSILLSGKGEGDFADIIKVPNVLAKLNQNVDFTVWA